MGRLKIDAQSDDSQLALWMGGVTKQAVSHKIMVLKREGHDSLAGRLEALREKIRVQRCKGRQSPARAAHCTQRELIREQKEAAKATFSAYQSRPVVGYEGLYSVTRCGRVWSHQSSQWMAGGIVPAGNGYAQVQLTKGKASKFYYFHRLVAASYIPNPEGKATVNHKDGDTRNNHVDNLEWATAKEQTAHALQTGLFKVGSRRSNAIIDEQVAGRILLLRRQGTKCKDIAEALSVALSTVRSVSCRQSWKHVVV